MDEGAVSLAEDVPLDSDVACAKCGYNLRTLAPSAKCPECATPVVTSLEYHRGRGAPDILRLRSGARWMLTYFLSDGICLLAMAVVPQSIFTQQGRSSPLLIGESLVVVLLTTALFIGMLRLSKSKPYAPSRRFLRLLCLLLPFNYLAVSIGATWSYTLQEAWMWLAFALAGALVRLHEIAVCVLGALFMHDLAKRWQHPLLRGVTPFVFGIYGLLSIVYLLLAIQAVALLAAYAGIQWLSGIRISGPLLISLTRIISYSAWIGPAVMIGYWFSITRAASRAAREVAMPKENA